MNEEWKEDLQTKSGLFLHYFLSLQVDGGGGGWLRGYWELRGNREVRGEGCEGLKGMAKGIKPVDLEWPFSSFFFL